MDTHKNYPQTLEEALIALQSEQIRATQLLEHAFAIVHQKDSQLHGLITVTKEDALGKAQQIDQARNTGEQLGVLAGIPIAHKDVFFSQGVRTTAGSGVLSNFKPDVSADVIQLLDNAGAISIGKTNCHEFAFGSPALDDFFPAARNPWNPEHMPGSSSSGSATAVAAGYCYAATASDTGGSVRHPAAACGLVGLKPSRGLISKEGLIPLAPSLDTVGIITRNVRDNLIMLCAILGSDYQVFLSELRSELPGIKIGVDFNHLGSNDITDEVRKTFLDSLKLFKELGAQIIPISLPDLNTIAQVANTIINFEGWQELKSFYEAQKENLGLGLQKKLELACKVSQIDYQDAIQLAQSYSELLTQTFNRQQDSYIDVILSVGREAPAQTMTDLYEHPTGARSTCNRLYSLTGHPAITLPMGFSVNSMPLALQIASQYHDEYLLYQVAHAFEKKRQVFFEVKNIPWQSTDENFS
jgi:aspartyl-tRNA(Asn)/glutamyl-tRNA(Gln) amidotransferase subunit A